MNERGKSDSPVVPAKPSNNAASAVAEVVEERGLAEGNAASTTRPGRSAGSGVPSALDRVREAARGDKGARFTALLHHVDVDRLRASYRAIRPQAAPGVDGVTWRAYGQDLEAKLRDLHARVHSGRYRAKPSRRAYIPEADGRLPLLGNVYLHYVLDLWVRQWRRRHAHGDVVFVRFADDFVAGFEHQADAQRFLADLRERFAKFSLELHPDKTRLIEFGRHAARTRAARGDGKPETFDFLGFT